MFDSFGRGFIHECIHLECSISTDPTQLMVFIKTKTVSTDSYYCVYKRKCSKDRQ